MIDTSIDIPKRLCLSSLHLFIFHFLCDTDFSFVWSPDVFFYIFIVVFMMCACKRSLPLSREPCP